jgi:hypothetical protein
MAAVSTSCSAAASSRVWRGASGRCLMRLPMERREPERSLPGVSSAHPGVADPAALAAYRAVAPALRALWPAALTGAEQLPASGAFLAVANHSGLGVVESLVLVDTWLEAVGPGVPLAAMAHSSLLRAPLAGALLRAVGAVEATREGAELAVRSGASLLLFPGGDHEAMRPLWRAREVDFAGRRGFIRLARALGAADRADRHHRLARHLAYTGGIEEPGVGDRPTQRRDEAAPPAHLVAARCSGCAAGDAPRPPVGPARRSRRRVCGWHLLAAHPFEDRLSCALAHRRSHAPRGGDLRARHGRDSKRRRGQPLEPYARKLERARLLLTNVHALGSRAPGSRPSNPETTGTLRPR